MAINTDPSTYEFAAYWLVSSDCLVRDGFGRTEPVDADARAAALERVHYEEVLAEPDQERAGETAPDPPPPVDARPRAVIQLVDDRREEAGTGTFRGQGRVLICVELPMPADYRMAGEESQAERATKFKNFRTWARQLMQTVRGELLATKGGHDEAGNPYLNAVTLDVEERPYDQDPYDGEPFVAFTLAAEWR